VSVCVFDKIHKRTTQVVSTLTDHSYEKSFEGLLLIRHNPSLIKIFWRSRSMNTLYDFENIEKSFILLKNDRRTT